MLVKQAQLMCAAGRRPSGRTCFRCGPPMCGPLQVCCVQPCLPGLHEGLLLWQQHAMEAQEGAVTLRAMPLPRGSACCVPQLARAAACRHQWGRK